MSDKNASVIIRTARPEDASALLDIYAPYVVNTAISFEYEVPSIEEFQARIKNILQKYPWLVAEKDGELLGYACTHAFVGRAAYDHSAETTIYLKENRTKMGVGKRLYLALEAISNVQNIYSLNACIGYPETEDEHLTMNSIQFHTHMGYRFVGKFYKCGYKAPVCRFSSAGGHTLSANILSGHSQIENHPLPRLQWRHTILLTGGAEPVFCCYPPSVNTDCRNLR